jgi:hypothetical protein
MESLANTYLHETDRSPTTCTQKVHAHLLCARILACVEPRTYPWMIVSSLYVDSPWCSIFGAGISILAGRGYLSALVQGCSRTLVSIVAPLAHGVAHSEYLPLKTWTGLANPHMRAQPYALQHRQRAVFAGHYQCGNFFAGGFFKRHTKLLYFPLTLLPCNTQRTYAFCNPNQLSSRHSRSRRRARCNCT